MTAPPPVPDPSAPTVGAPTPSAPVPDAAPPLPLAPQATRVPRGRKALYWLVGGVGLVAFGAAAWWLTGSSLHTQVIGYDTVDALHTTITFEITKDPAASVSCQVEAVSQSFGVVGVQVVEVGPTAARTSTVQASIPTQELAATARVGVCSPAPRPSHT